jgi:hypothetical protein
MRPTSTWLLILALLWPGALATPASAQDAASDASKSAEVETPAGTEVDTDVITEEPDVLGRDALAFNAEILDEVLGRSTTQTIREEKFAAAAGITGGMIMLGLAAWRLIEDDPQSQYSRGLGVMFMTLGMADLTLGVYAATRIPHEKHRLDRWQRARKDGITDIELAHFEGELQASHEIREGERLLVRWGGLTHALAGAMVLAFSPIPDSMSRTDRVSGYIVGGLFFAVGIGTFAASFRDTPSEKAWKEYNTRKMPMPGHEFHWGVAPSISKQGAGISFGGMF